jgi:hypothetical protein
MATAGSTTEQKESREQDKAGKSPIVVVDIGEAQSSVTVRRLRKGRGKLFNNVQRIVRDLVDDGTVKANAQPIVIVVRELPGPGWLMGDDDD